MTKAPNKSLQATRDGALSSAIAEDVISPACLILDVSQHTMSQHFPANVDPELVAELKHYRKLAAMQPHDDVKMDLPEGARVKTEQGAWKVRWRGICLSLVRHRSVAYDQQVALFNEPAKQYAHLYSITVTPVTFGGVTGVRRVQIVRDLDSKSVDYALEVPGGFAHAGIVRRGMAWDESEWEQFFQTIQMIKNDKAG